MKANNTQVGGTHYRTESEFQHWDLVYMIFGGDYLLGNASKYMARIGKKGGLEKSIEDLDKASHYLLKKREMLELQLLRETAMKAGVVMNDGEASPAYVNQDPDLQYRGDLRFQNEDKL